MPGFLEDLSRLTGEEAYQLAVTLGRHRDKAILAIASSTNCYGQCQGLEDLAAELLAVQLDVMAQLARITIPLREAQGIIWRARFARGHPVRMVPQDS